MIEQTYSLQTESFRYLGLQIRPDPVSGGQVVTHHVEVHGPQPEAYLLFNQFLPHGNPASARTLAKSFPNTPDSRQWTPGERLTLSQTLRLPVGTYAVYIGFATYGARPRRLPLGLAGDMLPLGLVTIDAPPLPLLQRSAGLLPADLPGLLHEVLALPALPGAQIDHLTLCFGQASQFGHVMEFGVATGATITHLALMAPHRTVWGFDTFEGLPEPWVRSEIETVEAGAFSRGGKLPVVPGNVALVTGLIQDTLPRWRSENPGNVSFIHVDVDLYSATRFILDCLDDRIVPGTVVVFDDVALWSALKEGGPGRYPNWMDGEWKALNEWADRFRRRFAVTSRLENSVLGIRVLV